MAKHILILMGSALILGSASVLAQQPQAPPPLQRQTPQAAPQPAPANTQAPPSDGKIRIYVSDTNYAVILDHEGGKGALRRRNKVAVFNRDGDAIFSDSTRELGNSVKDACAAITKDQASKEK